MRIDAAVITGLTLSRCPGPHGRDLCGCRSGHLGLPRRERCAARKLTRASRRRGGRGVSLPNPERFTRSRPDRHDHLLRRPLNPPGRSWTPGRPAKSGPACGTAAQRGPLLVCQISTRHEPRSSYDQDPLSIHALTPRAPPIPRGSTGPTGSLEPLGFADPAGRGSRPRPMGRRRPWRTGSSADATAEAAPSALPLELSRTRGPRPRAGSFGMPGPRRRRPDLPKGPAGFARAGAVDCGSPPA